MAELMWSEKYRPKQLDDLVDQKDVVQGLKSLLKSPNELPHLLFTGPPGSGKTTVAFTLARHLLGSYMADYTLALNASDERRIDDIRNKVKTFARYFDRRVEVPFRIIILDEADAMTSDAQTALRRIMEEYSSYTRFILTANYGSDIISPIQSRCALFRFTRLPQDEVIDFLKEICVKEKTRYSEQAISLVYEFTNGDVRQAINMLQACAALGGVTEANVKKMAGVSAKAKVDGAIGPALEGKFKEARLKMIEALRVYSIDERDFLRFAYEKVQETHSEDPRVADIFAKYDARLVSSATPEIQLSALLAELASLKKKKEAA